MREACGVFGIFAPKEEVASLSYFGLLGLQHRGQESAGIASSDFREVRMIKGMGLVSQVFDEEKLKLLKGKLAIGHTRYSTAGSSTINNAQPIVVKDKLGELALGHNGNLVNYKKLKQELKKKGHKFEASADSEVIGQLIVEAKGRSWREKMVKSLEQLKGSFSLVMLTKDKLFAVRDGWGIRPLVLGKVNKSGWLVASESSVIESIGGKVIREVKPGEMLEISKKGIKSFYQLKQKKTGFCIFEYIYFSRPDSVIGGQLVHSTRVRSGKRLVKEHSVKADMVISVPDSGTSAALGFSEASKIKFQEGLIKSRYIGRTFIQPSQRIRDLGVNLKFNPLKEVIKGKRVVIVDDSIVRGTTLAQLIKMLKQAGVKEVHVRIASPPFKNICYLGIDVNRYEELIASRLEVEATRKKLKADSLGYLSLAGLKQAIGKVDLKFCTGCFNSNYPVDLR